ncbi:MAG TPA: toprim domain-containing protein, partial [Acetobacteraceae bacterium]|nr:toprim domain-containing protein [Acetobacteraceae bacterium]
PSFTVYADGHFHCFGCGAHGDAISFIRRIEGVGFIEAQERVGDVPRRQDRPQHRQRGTGNYAAHLLANSLPIPGTLAERYLREVRGLEDLPLPSELRFHPAVWSRETSSAHPALLIPCSEGAARHPGEQRRHCRRIQAVLLERTTGGKAKVGAPKLTFGAGVSHVPASFAAREVSPHEDTFTLLTEGPEDAIVVQAVTGWQADASLGAGSLGKPQYAAGINLVIFGDNGETGHTQAEAAAEAHRARGANVWLVYPPEGVADANDLLRLAGPEAVRAQIEAAIAADPPASRPNCTMDELRAAMTAGVEAWVTGEGPGFLLNSASTSTGKGVISLKLLAHLAKVRREQRKQFIQDWRRDHPKDSAHHAAEAATAAGARPLRVAYVGDNHGVVGQHVAKARALGMIAAHEAGIDRPYDPADTTSPPRCTQPERMKQTRIAGEPARLVACGLDLLGPHCADRDGCREWQSIEECAHAEFVGMVAERATAFRMPRELLHFDFVLIDEPPDRVFRPERDIMLDLLADHLFERNPVRDDDSQPDFAATEDAREKYAAVRFLINGMQNGYWPREAMTNAGCDAAFFARLVELTDRRDAPTGMTAATSDHERASMARFSFRNAVRRLCAFFRLAQAIQAGEEGSGRIEIVGDAPRTAVMRPRAHLHPTLLKARIMVAGANLEFDRVAQWLPGVQPMAVDGMIPHAPHQTLVHFHKGMGKGAMASEARRRWARALVALEGADSNPDATGVAVLKSYGHEFADLPGVIVGHHGAMVGRKDWERCSIFFGFGARFLSPADAAAAGAAETGEDVPIKRPVRMLRRVAMRDGRSLSVPVFEYEHPAAQWALCGVRDFDVMQGQLGRPRAPNRTAADPVLTFDVGMHVPHGAVVDFLITSPDQYAPDRFVMMLAEGLAVEHSRGRHRIHPAIYRKDYTGGNDKRLEAGGFVATALRVLCPPWRRGPRQDWVIGRYWRPGHARRKQGELFLSTVRQLDLNMRVLREKERATRIEIDRTIKAQPHAGKLAINLLKEGTSPVIASPPDVPPARVIAGVQDTQPTPWRAERPPDG